MRRTLASFARAIKYVTVRVRIRPKAPPTMNNARFVPTLGKMPHHLQMFVPEDGPGGGGVGGVVDTTSVKCAVRETVAL